VVSEVGETSSLGTELEEVTRLCGHNWEPHTITPNTVVKVKCSNCGKILAAGEVSKERREKITAELIEKGSHPFY